MKRFLLAALLLVAPARADDLNARATQIKAQLQTQWLPAWAAKSPANESAVQAAQLLRTLSHAHRLGYSIPQLDLLGAARVHYKLLRDSRRDKISGAFFVQSGNNQPSKETEVQAVAIAALVEYARVSGEREPRNLAIKTWRLVRDLARDKTNGGYFVAFLSGPLAPTQASGIYGKVDSVHLSLLNAGTQLYLLTHDQSIKRDLQELLDLNEGRFFPSRTEDAVSSFWPDWKPYILRSNTHPFRPTSSFYSAAALTIARAQEALEQKVRWVDFTRRIDIPKQDGSYDDALLSLPALAVMARNFPANRDAKAVRIDAILDQPNGGVQFPILMNEGNGLPWLDFVAAFEAPTGTQP